MRVLFVAERRTAGNCERDRPGIAAKSTRKNPINDAFSRKAYPGKAYNFASSAWRCTMILGMSTSTFTMLHVVISLIGIGSGLVVMSGFLNAKRLNGITAIFLVSTVLTSVTGFAFPNEHITPGIVVGILSLIVLAIAIAARYALHLSGLWRAVYVVTAAIALYFNCFVFVVQSFEKVPALHALAPTQKEPPFAIAQLFLLVLFIVFTVLAVKRFRIPPAVSQLSNTTREKGAA
jgi:hypothetical protein